MLAKNYSLFGTTLSRGEWCFLVDIFNGHFVSEADFSPDVLVAVIEDGLFDKDGGYEEKWDINRDQMLAKFRAAISSNRLGLMDLIYIYEVISFFWDNRERINIQTDPWWTPDYILNFNRPAAEARHAFTQ